MNPVIGDWIRRQAVALYDGESCTAFRLFHVALGERTTPLDRYLLGEGEDPAGVIGRVQALAQQHAEAFAGMPQRYMLTACYGPSQNPQANYVWRLSGSASSLVAAGSEPPTAEGQTAQMMRHMEFLVRTLGEMSSQRFREQTAQSEGMQTQLQWLQAQLLEQHKQAGVLRLAAEDTKDRQHARELETLQVVKELERPVLEENFRRERLKPVMDMLPMLLPSLQTFINAKMGVPVPTELNPIMQRLAHVFEAGRSALTEKDLAAVLGSLPPEKRIAMMQIFQALQEAHEFTKKQTQSGATSAAPQPDVTQQTQAPQTPTASASAPNGAPPVAAAQSASA